MDTAALPPHTQGRMLLQVRARAAMDDSWSSPTAISSGYSTHVHLKTTAALVPATTPILHALSNGRNARTFFTCSICHTVSIRSRARFLPSTGSNSE
jgi:hypothetical protein